MKNRLIIGSLILIILSSCEEKKTVYPLFSDTTFFTYHNNTVLHFTGDSIVYNDFTHLRDSIRFFYIDSLVAIDTTVDGLHFFFNRYINYPNQVGYTYLKNYSILQKPFGVLLYEDLNQNFILPKQFDRNSYWNGNQYQSADEQLYSILNITNENFAGGYRTLLEVEMKDEYNLIAEDKLSMNYAEGLGIIKLYHKNISKDIVTGAIKSGSILNLVYNP